MSCNSPISCSSTIPSGCADQYGCISGVCPDFTIRRHDTKPEFKVRIDDCDGPLDLEDLVIEASMWAKGKLKISLDTDDTVIALADGIGFNQIMVEDVIYMDQARLPEKMLVTGFDEPNRLVHVERGYGDTSVQAWKKGTPLRIMKFVNNSASTEMVYQDILEIDGTTTSDVLTDSFLIYTWSANDTCLPGCYYMEFKLMKMVEALRAQVSVPDDEIPEEIAANDVVPNFTDPSLTPTDFGCDKAAEIEWIRRFPVDSEGFYIKIYNSPTVDD